MACRLRFEMPVRTLLNDLRYALRVSRKSLGFTLVAVATLAVGIAANTTVFGWIDSVLLHPLPGATGADRLVSFETLTPDGDFITTSYADYRDYRDNLKLLSGLAVAQMRPLSVGDEDRTERVWGELVSGNYFSVLGVKPALGRVFTPDEYGDKEGGYPMAVIGYGLWQRRFHSDPGVIGTTVRVNRLPLTIVGVAPPEFRGIIPGLSFQVWVPTMMGPQLNVMPDWMLRDRKNRAYVSVARLQPDVTLARARSELASVARQLAKSYPGTNRGIGATVLPLYEGHFGAQSLLLRPLQILMAVGGVVLLIVCANLANLLLARSTARQKEFGLRLALGAGRGRLIRQMLTENLVLAALGALAAVPLALWLKDALGYLVPPGVLPLSFDAGKNADVLGFLILVSAVACVASGLAPAIQTSRANLSETLNEGGRGGTAGSHSRRMRSVLVASEVALALVAIIGAGLFARSFQMARRIDPGFDANHVLVSVPHLSTAAYSVPARIEFCRRLRERIQAQPGVAGAAYSDIVPLGFEGGSWEDLQIQGYLPSPSENMKIYRNVVAPGYFDLMRIKLLEGRDFTELDDEKSQPVMIVTEGFAHRFLAGQDPIGHKVQGWGKWFTIVGVVKDSKYRRLNETPQAYFYVPFRQVYRADLGIAFYVRMAGDARQAMPLLRREIRAMDPSVAVFDAMPLSDYIGASLFPQKVAASLLGVLGVIALILAAVGLYSVMAYAITQRTHEIGIRMALGARPRDVLAMVVRQAMVLTLAGVAAGMAGALVLTRMAAGLLINVSARDPLVFGGAAVFLTVVALAASWIPARRATRVDPNAALRCQ